MLNFELTIRIVTSGTSSPTCERSRTMKIETLSERIANAENKIGKKQITIAKKQAMIAKKQQLLETKYLVNSDSPC